MNKPNRNNRVYPNIREVLEHWRSEVSKSVVGQHTSEPPLTAEQLGLEPIEYPVMNSEGTKVVGRLTVQTDGSMLFDGTDPELRMKLTNVYPISYSMGATYVPADNGCVSLTVAYNFDKSLANDN